MGIKNCIPLPMEARVTPEDEAAGMAALQLHEDVGILTLEAVQDVRVHHDDDVSHFIPVLGEITLFSARWISTLMVIVVFTLPRPAQ